MKLKHTAFIITAAAVSTFLFTGCSFQGSGDKDTENSQINDNNDNRTANSNPNEIGTVIEEDGIKKVTVFANENFNVSDDSGAFEYTIDSVSLVKVSADTDVAAKSIGIEKGEEAAMLTLKLSAENVGYETVNCYISQATLTTDTGETVEPKSLLGDYMDGHFGAGQKKTGSNVYIFKNTKAEDINNLSMYISAPKDNDFKPVGDEVELDFSLK